MLYKKLGTTDLNVSVLGLGTWQFSGEWGKEFTEKEVAQILREAEMFGVNLVDTAECYGNHLSERFIGDFLHKNKNRNKWVIATKFGHKYKGFLDMEECWSPKEVKKQLENSLRFLRTDYIDIYQFHSGGDRVFKQDALWQMLGEEKKAGKIRYLGLSISEREVLNDNLYQLHRVKARGIDIIQVRYNWLHREAERTLLPECEKLRLGVLARQPLAYGYLSGKYGVGYGFPENDVRYWQDKNIILKEVQLVDELKLKLGNGDNDMAQWSINWCFENQSIDCVVVGCKSVEQLRNNVEAIKQINT